MSELDTLTMARAFRNRSYLTVIKIVMPGCHLSSNVERTVAKGGMKEVDAPLIITRYEENRIQ